MEDEERRRRRAPKGGDERVDGVATLQRSSASMDGWTVFSLLLRIQRNKRRQKATTEEADGFGSNQRVDGLLLGDVMPSVRTASAGASSSDGIGWLNFAGGGGEESVGRAI
uniref:DUF834 domain-containing protein n=1 Tax=Leersia perrieri TaxID=77586 RepID=A0A0D9VYW8_9ORYZ